MNISYIETYTCILTFQQLAINTARHHNTQTLVNPVNGIKLSKLHTQLNTDLKSN